MAIQEHTEQNFRIDRSLDLAEQMLTSRSEHETMKVLVEVHKYTPEEAFLAIKGAQTRPPTPRSFP